MITLKALKCWLAQPVSAKSKEKTMMISLSLIGGFMLGFEYVFNDEEETNHIVFDLAIVRIMFTW